MRNRHIPRVCATCDKPMSGQDDICWNCGAVWTDPHAKAPVPTAGAAAIPGAVT